jgi:hypothetical protein
VRFQRLVIHRCTRSGCPWRNIRGGRLPLVGQLGPPHNGLPWAAGGRGPVGAASVQNSNFVTGRSESRDAEMRNLDHPLELLRR